MNRPTIRDIRKLLGREVLSGYHDKRLHGVWRIKLFANLVAVDRIRLQHWLDITYPNLTCKVYTHMWSASYNRKVLVTCIRYSIKA